MTNLSTVEAAAEIRKSYKAAGIKASVRSRSFSMGSAIDVTVKSGSFMSAKEIAESFSRVDRCEITGEILSGCNCYVSIELDREVVAAKEAEIADAFDTAIASADDHTFCAIAGTNVEITAKYALSKTDECSITPCYSRACALRRVASWMLGAD
jgi:hypothetical protein